MRVIRKKKVLIHAYVNHCFDLASDYAGIAKNACFILSLHHLIHTQKVEQALLMKENKKAHVNRVMDYAAKYALEVDQLIEEHPKKGMQVRTRCIDLYGGEEFINKLERLAEERDMKFSAFVRKLLQYSVVEERFFDYL
jgi:hypothetical protein